MAVIEHLVTDMGNGAAFCSACGHKLSEDPLATLPERCPKCSAEFTGENMFPYNYGVSDF